ncbi:MAG: hypothetical protein Q7S37_04050 [bacterium]|nr:hypothetical protein [bacterium]
MLDKNDLKEIKKIVDASEQKLDKKIDLVKNEIITTISREVNDLADINRAVINKIEELDYRLRIVERKLGLNVR